MQQGEREYFPPSEHPELSDIGRRLVIAWEEAAGPIRWTGIPKHLGKKYERGDFNTIWAMLAPHWISVLLLLVVTTEVIFLLPFDAEPYDSLTIVIFFAVSLLIGIAGWFVRPKAYALHIHEQLSESNLLERLLLRDQELLEITNHVPWPFRILYIRYLKLDTKQTAKLVALNLDWYLRPRLLLVRWEWFLMLTSILVLTATLLVMLSLALSLVAPTLMLPSMFAVFLILYSFFIIGSFTILLSQQRRIIHCDALIAHFLARHADQQDGQHGE